MAKRTTSSVSEVGKSPRLGTEQPGLRRRNRERDDELPLETPHSVSAGPIEKALELAFNPSDDMLPSVTIIDRVQGRLFPIINVINLVWMDVLEIAYYRQDKDEYKRVFGKSRPVSPNLLAKLLHYTALWQKSVQGANLTKITDIALAETETRAGDEGEGYGSVDAWGKE
tara:strand:- start:882 stop:1391 length:510 start_codon:yes stop_codon:yes gene_type:complete